MKIDEMESIEQSFSDGHFIRIGKQVKANELKACLKFFEEVDIIKANKTPETVNAREEELIVVFNMVMDREILISNFNLDTNEPSFIKNTIQTQ